MIKSKKKSQPQKSAPHFHSFWGCYNFYHFPILTEPEAPPPTIRAHTVNAMTLSLEKSIHGVSGVSACVAQTKPIINKPWD